MENLIVDGKQPPRVGDDGLTSRRQGNRGNVLVEHIRAEQRLQALDLRTDRRLGHAQRLRGLGEAPVVDNRDQCSQQFSWNVDHIVMITGIGPGTRPRLGKKRLNQLWFNVLAFQQEIVP